MKPLALDEAVEKLEKTAERWLDKGKGSIFSLISRTAKQLSNDPVFNTAAWLKYNFGPLYTGETNEDWLESVKEIQKILKP